MKKARATVFYIFLGYHLILFLSSLYIDSKQNDLGFLLEMKSYISAFKYFTLFGLILYMLGFLIVQRDSLKLTKEVSKAKDEHTVLKAKLFDLQEEKKQSGTTTNQSSISEKSVSPGPSDTESDSKEEDDTAKG